MTLSIGIFIIVIINTQYNDTQQNDPQQNDT